MTRRGPTDYPAAPRLTRLVLALLRVPPTEREFIKGDLDEGYTTTRTAHGLWRAQLWYWRQLLSMVRVPWRRPTSPIPPRPREPLMRTIVHDLRYVLRGLRRAPLFSTFVVLTLTVGIGATSAVFSVVHPIVLAEPPYPGADRLVMIWGRDLSGAQENVGFTTIDDLRRETASFQSVAVIGWWLPTIRSGDETQRVEGRRVSWQYFSVLGVRPAIGRDFRPEEDTPETRRVAILSHRIWATQFGGDSAVVGKQSTINGVTYLIVGVMPADFRDLLSPNAEIWTPIGYALDGSSSCRSCRHLRAIARVRDDVSVAVAEQDTRAFFASMRERYPDQYATGGAFVTPLKEELAGNVRAPLLGLFGAVVLLMLLASANVASLFLGRTGERQAELAIRLALGAERSRLVRFVTLEAVVLAVVGGALGLAAAWAGTRVLLGTMPIPDEIAGRVEIAGTVVVFALAITALSALIGAALPALFALRDSSLADLRVGARVSLNRARHRVRHGIVVAEVALAMLLLAGAGLQVRSLREALSVHMGFDPRGVLAMELTLSGQQYVERAAVHTYFREAMDAARAVPGVEHAAVVSQLPLGGNYDGYGFHREDKPATNDSEDPSAQRFAVSAGYFETMRIQVLRGRGFTAADRDGSEFVVIVNRAAVDNIYAGDDPIGKRIRFGGPAAAWRTIVGVVENVRHLSLEGDLESHLYMPFEQHLYAEDLALVARTNGDPTAIAEPVRKAVRAVDPGVAISGVRPMEAVIAGVAAPRRLALSLVGGFALIAVVLALGGIYGVMAASVSERVREIGLRAALGATPRRLVAEVVGRGLLLALAGTAIGVGLFVAARGMLARFVFGVPVMDAITLTSVAALLCGVAIVACALPAFRAARIDPLVALRE